MIGFTWIFYQRIVSGQGRTHEIKGGSGLRCAFPDDDPDQGVW